jgi:hypothetical protein
MRHPERFLTLIPDTHPDAQVQRRESCAGAFGDDET